MQQIKTRRLLLGLVSAAACFSTACGSSSDDDGSAGWENATAVSATAPGHAFVDTKGVAKLDPIVRPGAEAPLDSSPEAAPEGQLPSSPVNATRTFASGFESGVSLTEPTGRRNGDRQLVGTDSAGYAFPIDLWSAPSSWRNWVLSVVGEQTPAPVTDFLTASIKPVAGRNAGLTNALSLHSRVQSGGGGQQQIVVQHVGMAEEVVTYQRMWIKLDTGLPARAQSVGAADFYQTFWEATARPDYRIRLNIRQDESSGLYWQAIADKFDGQAPDWQAELKTVPVVIAPASSAAGWHQVELWIDRPNGRFKVAIDGTVLVDRTGNLTGDNGSRIDQFRMMMVHSGVAPLAEVLFDDLELWDAPPANAWRL